MACDFGELDVDYSAFPTFQCSIGYGSGVFRQEGYGANRPMVDLLLVVADEELEWWHEGNLSAQPEHYSKMARLLGPAAVCRWQRWGPGVLYLPEVQLRTNEGGVLNAKYGVISFRDLLKDLESWSSLYIAGRLQKPFLYTWRNGLDYEDIFEDAVVQNRRSALAAALLSAEKDRLDVFELLASVVGLSYGGDIRVGLAENPHKVSNIVTAQRDLLWTIYQPLAEELGVEENKGMLHFDASLAGRRRLFSALPDMVQRDAKVKAGAQEPFGEPLRKCLQSTVRRASVQQAIKGVVSSGAGRSFRYVLQKVAKRLR